MALTKALISIYNLVLGLVNYGLGFGLDTYGLGLGLGGSGLDSITDIFKCCSFQLRVIYFIKT